ncbi:MAG: 1-(5-phosphoribosyl)-5-[(5-phosphoribosylamino)methylideneamino]imidazole-4-carboxamide isomerase [Chloroflexota bacterium]|jgi:phosphoribosylformimino-5-aminoimidazole carboxamide ribotide isomerase|uniref:1-(5-phosphoribosyl)-5-[(5-phosphoribosylamino)methylideneamino]imidazole-4-carboxamideisomerase n=1 Tax=marine metagenome TaxID=408172 RepID=A0A381SEX7_9ZZZZ|nr:1-(5-phosphoribosyl)-5-[(5-phosphoribosylamino)methylideneamino]imidazole-4-carboxamide isomerase [Chloroflexota bacterium]
MEIIPAIDILDGKCVRLFQGDFDRETIFANDPVEMALRWESEGASCLHIVDLDGAKGGEISNSKTIKKIRNSTNARIQVGGGIRSVDSAKRYADIGVDRLIIGTAAVESPETVSSIINIYGPSSVIISVDARDGIVELDGWTRRSEVSAKSLVQEMVSYGVIRCMYTDITRDGTLTEPNYNSIEDLVEFAKISVLAAGGISTVESLMTLDKIGVEAAIVGRAIYTGDLDLRSALDAIK